MNFNDYESFISVLTKHPLFADVVLGIWVKICDHRNNSRTFLVWLLGKEQPLLRVLRCSFIEIKP